jgi:L-ascorbate oxidase
MQPGTYFYHGHYGLQRSAGLYGSLIVDSAKTEPFVYDGELSIILNDWWHTLAVGLSSNPFVWIGEPHVYILSLFCPSIPV